MKYSYSWLKELSGTELSAEKVADLLTMHSFEIEGLEKVEGIFKNFVVGEILEIKKHPNADRLQIAKVNVGKAFDLGVELATPLQIVCGAPNIAVGQKVPVAMPGAQMAAGFQIKESEIRGVKSFGMICAEDELGIGENHDGILVLEKNAKIGEDLDQYFARQKGSKEDWILEMKVLPDRAHDAMSHVGMAREIAALDTKHETRNTKHGGMDYDFDGLNLPKKKTKILKVEIRDKKLCQRYIGAVMTNVKIQPSPEWMQERLKISGMKPINNVVDATNYVMLELGQPLHAFDAEKLKTQNAKRKTTTQSEKVDIIVRRSKNGEKMMLLDDKEVELTENDLLITNGETPLALAGIKGGKESGITEDTTKSIVLEAASFSATNIRRTRTRLGIRTDSSDRYEKELDPNLTEKAMVRVIEILEHTAGAKLEGIVDEYPEPVKPWKIKLDLNYVNALLGEEVSFKEVVEILELLGLKTQNEKRKVTAKNSKQKNDQHIEITIPTFRIDLKTQEDLIEEIGRVRGYEKIETRPILGEIRAGVRNEQAFFERKVQETLMNLGFSEMYNYSFYSLRDAGICGLSLENHFEVANPMNPDQELVRISLLPNLLKNVRENLKHFENFKIFEQGKIYFSKDNAVEEKRMLVGAVVLNEDKGGQVFFEAKGAVEDLLESLGFGGMASNLNPNDSKNILWHPGRSAEIMIRNEVVGKIGEIDWQVLEGYKIKKRTAVFELDTEKLREAVFKNQKEYASIPKFPKITRDVSLVAKPDIRVADISEKIKTVGGELVNAVEMFDIFEKDGRIMSYAFHINFLDPKKTLESEEVEVLFQKILSTLKNDLGVEVKK